jgi:tetratricopeptide (TPR) repeat protein
VAAPLHRSLAPGSFGNHEILDEIGRGGMGVVYKARHKGLGRIVALKMLLAGSLASGTDLKRFRAEAEAAASLDHPHIVPIYDVGEHDGRPFLAMKFMEGGSLARRSLQSTEVDAPTGGQPPQSSLPPTPRHTPTEAARLVAPLARAIDHAHRRGVLHRDLKPANILLDEQGRPHVSDFGLARRLDADAALTQSGAILGTPAYMAPEQAAGGRGAVTTATDIYGLGTILYELVTGRPPFQGDSMSVLRQVLDEDPPRPRSLKPNLDRDLETIILKCLHKDPSRRYTSAKALADDLERFLAGRPIHARPTTPVERAWRWVLRSPVAVGLGAALVLCLLVGLGGSVFLWLRAEAAACEARTQRDEARQAREEAEQHRIEAEKHARAASQERDEADRHLRLAHQVVAEFCLHVSQELASVPSLQPLRRTLLLKALGYYEQFLKRLGNDPALKRELADTHRNVAQIQWAIGGRDKARAAYEQARKLYEELLEVDPDNVALQRALTGTLIDLAIQQDARSALETSARAVQLFERYLTTSPADLDLRGGYALMLGNRGAQLVRTGRVAEGEECLSRALEKQEELLREYPGNEAFQSELASTLGNVGVMATRRFGERPLALCYFLRADELREKLAQARPNDPRRQADLAASRQNVGNALWDVGMRNPARQSLQQALDTRRKLAKDHPLVRRYQIDLSLSLTRLGRDHSHEGRREKELVCYEEARTIQQKLVEQDQSSPVLRKILAESWFNIGTVHGALNQRPQEGEALQKARQIQEKLVQAEPDNLDYRLDLTRTLNNQGINLWLRGENNTALAVLREAITSGRLLLDKAPDVLSHRQALNNPLGNLAEIEWRLGHGTASAEVVRQRIALWPNKPAELGVGAIELARAATVADGNDRVRILDEAMKVLAWAVTSGYRDLNRLRADPGLELLRPRADFKALLETLDQRTAQR